VTEKANRPLTTPFWAIVMPMSPQWQETTDRRRCRFRYAAIMHVIDSENYLEAAEAIRDILMLYVDLADSTAGFGHAADWPIRFDPIKFVDSVVKTDSYDYVDLNLLQAGSAIAIICMFYNLWCEEQPLKGHPLSERYEAALLAGRLARFPDIEVVLREAVARNQMPLGDPWFERALIPIYRKYVLGFFARLACADRSGS
jgi:hypothetical protein